MALTRQASTAALLGSTRFATKNENADSLLARAGVGKPRPTSTATRNALGNISNRSSSAVVVGDKKKQLKDPGFVKPSRPATKSAAPRVQKENVSAIQKEIQKAPEKPDSPMDVSGSEAFSKALLPANVADIDKDDADNPQLVSEYVNDIYDYLRELEAQYPIKAKYLDKLVINGRMRAILVDWLVQVHLRFHLLQETLYLTVSIIDRFLQLQEVSRSKLQLVGVTAMLIASKYEEMYAPEINDFVYITDNAYSKKDICAMERLMLRTLGFNLGKPLPLHFLRRNSKAGEVDANKHTLAKYLTELTITDYDMVHVRPSEIAAAALCLSMKLLDASDWNSALQHYSKYTEEELRPVMCKLCSLVTRAGAGKLTTIKTKYSSSKFMRIALLPQLSSQLVTDLTAEVDKTK